MVVCSTLTTPYVPWLNARAAAAAFSRHRRLFCRQNIFDCLTPQSAIDHLTHNSSKPSFTSLRPYSKHPFRSSPDQGDLQLSDYTRPKNLNERKQNLNSIKENLSVQQQISRRHRHSELVSRGQLRRLATSAKPASRREEREEMPDSKIPESPSKGHDKPLVVGRTKPAEPITTDPTSSDARASLNHAIEENLKSNTTAAAPAEEATASTAQPTKKKEKAPKQPKPQKAPTSTAPLSPALLDLRVGHILRCVTHPNADSLFVSTIAMGDAEGADHTSIDEETGKVVRTVCSGLNGLVPIEEMQDRKVVVVANLKPVTMRGIKSAAMVLAASPATEEGADPHAADRVVELVMPPKESEAGDAVYFEGWEYGEGKGPEKQLNPKKKQWEGIQPGFYTSQELCVGFDAGSSEVEGSEKGELIVEGKGKCTVKTLKGAVVR